MDDNEIRSQQQRESDARELARSTFDALRTKWTLPILEACGPGLLRFTELQRALDGVSPKMLAQTLRAMEGDGLVVRTDHGTAHPHVDYRLSPAGLDLLSTVHSLCSWSRRHLDELERARSH